MLALVAFLVVGSAAGQSATKPVAPGFQFLGYGYDILLGNMLDTRGVGDVGYKSNVFTFTTKDQQTTSDGMWTVPDKTTAQEMPDCTLNLSNHTINSTKSYNKALNVTFAVPNFTYENESNPKLQKIAFNFNVETRHVDNAMNVHNMTFMQESFTCNTYHLSMALFNHPDFDSNFLAGVDFLPEVYDESTVYIHRMFIQQFGTHVVTQLNSGGRWGWQTEFKYDDVQKVKKDGLDFDLGLEIAAKIKAGFKIGVHKEDDSVNAVTEIIQMNASFNIGGEFTPDAAAWKESVKQKPMPVYHELTPIADLLNPFLLKGVDAAVLTKKRVALKMALSKYCDYLRATVDESVSCKGVNEEETTLVLV